MKKLLTTQTLLLRHPTQPYVSIDGDVRDIRVVHTRLLVAQRQLVELREEFLEHVRALRVCEDILQHSSYLPV